MACKASIVVAVLAFLAVASAFPGFSGGYGYEEEHDHAPSQYEFQYAVHDAHSGDVKQQSESRHGGVVKGQYSLVEPDGSLRTVTYTADPHSGFKAVVSRPGPHGHQEVTHHGH